jgi:MFS family permease
MSEYLAAAAQALNTTESIVRRSAEARAKATGVSVDEVLAAWAGGGALSPAPTAAPAPTAPAAAPAPSVPEPAVAAVEAPAETPVVVMMEPPIAVAPEALVEAAPLAERVRRGWRVAAWAGLGISFFVMIFATQWLLPRAGLIGEEGSYRAAVLVVPGWLIVGAGLLGVVSGIVLAGFSRAAVGWSGPGHVLTNSAASSAAVGAVVGGLLGLVTGAIVAGSGQTVETQEGVVNVAVLGALIWTAIGWVALGALVGSMVQFLGVPAGISAEEAEEAAAVRRRLRSAFGLPIMVALSILAIVGPVALAFLAFPKWAPLTGAFVALSVLAFSGLASARPNLKITRGEFALAVTGVVTVLVIIVSVLAAQGGGGHEEEEGTTGQEQPAAG